MLDADFIMKCWCIEPKLIVFGYLQGVDLCEWRLYVGVEMA